MEIYTAKLSENKSIIDCDQIMSRIEHKKLERICSLRNDEDFHRKLLGEMLVRDILLKHYKLNEESLVFSSSSLGKPFLLHHMDIHFNISSSDDYVVCAVGSEEVGIDIEHIIPIDLLVAKYFFSYEEIRTLNGYEGARKLEYFYEVWTAKESYVKAVGKGIGFDLERYTVRESGGSIRLFEGEEETNFHFGRYMVGDDYVITICSETPVEGIIPETWNF